MAKKELKKPTWRNFESHLFNEGVTEKRRNKLKTMFNIVSRGISKDFDKLNRTDIEQFLNNLNRDKFRKIDNNAFSGCTKSDIKKFLKQFWKWYKGNNEFYPKEVAWIKTKISKDEKPKEKPVLTRQEVIKLANTFSKPEYRILTLLLWDSGFRIMEMLSIKKQDITWERFYENEKCFWIKCNASKTEERKIPVPQFQEDIKNFMNSSYFQGLKDTDIVFNLSYEYFLRKLKENSQKLLNKKVTCHALRHSSATFYAGELDGNMNMLAERYGWAYSSDQLKTYIRRSGAYQKQGAKKVFVNELLKVREEMASLSEKHNKLQSEVKKLSEALSFIKKYKKRK